MVADAYNHRLIVVQDAVHQQRQRQHALPPPDLSPRSSLAARRAAISRAITAHRHQHDLAPNSSSVLTSVAPAWKYPHDVAVSDEGHVFVSDFDGNAVWRNTWEGVSQGQEWQVVDPRLRLNHPCGLSWSSASARLAVADCYNNRVGILSPPALQPHAADANAATSSSAIWSTCHLSHPTGVCWSRDNSCVAVADFDNGRVVWLRGDTLVVEGDVALGARSRAYDVECVGEVGGAHVWVATDCVSSRVFVLERDARVKGGVASCGSAAMMAS
jgi:hypothetical protein